jgi:hypothetical protein
MGLTDDEYQWLDRLFAKGADHLELMSEWQRGFFEDNQKRFIEYGVNFRVSSKQYEQLRKIDELLEGEAE